MKYLSTLKRCLKKYDYAVVFFAMMAILALLSKQVYTCVIVSYVVAVFYYIISNIVRYKGFCFFHIFLLTGPVLFVVFGLMYVLQLYLIK